MQNAGQFLSHRKEIESAIAQAEAQTSAEIICAVATESGRYDRAEATIGLLFSLIALWGAHWGFSLASPSGGWDPVIVPLWVQMLAVVVGFIVGNVVASYVHALRRLAVRSVEMDAETRRAASAVFHDKRLASTRSRGGVLIYISLFERRVIVLADEAARKALGADGIEKLRDLGVEKLRDGARDESFLAVITEATKRLAESFPPSGSSNEVADEVLVFHPRP